ncbi:MAG: addiction module protein [Desulfonatronovibrio sp.]
MLMSTNLPSKADIDQAWSKEVESRFEQVENGQARLVPGEEVFEKIRKRLAK